MLIAGEMMITFENVIEIDRSVSTVFQFLLNLENLPKWNYFVLEVRKLDPGQPAVGDIYHQRRKTDSQRLTIIELEPDRLLTVETVPPSKPQLIRTMTFTEVEERTRVIDRWQLDTGHPGFLQALGKGRIRSAVYDNLKKLKELLENGSVTLQDGRRSTL
jgi:uncharacterized membrane protein